MNAFGTKLVAFLEHHNITHDFIMIMNLIRQGHSSRIARNRVILERLIFSYPLRINSFVYKIGNCFCYNYCYWPTFRGVSYHSCSSFFKVRSFYSMSQFTSCSTTPCKFLATNNSVSQLLHQTMHIYKIYKILHIKRLKTLRHVSVLRPSSGSYNFLANVTLEIVTY